MGGRIWAPRSFTIDLSSIEENAISRLFPGLPAVEQEVGNILLQLAIFYCSWHTRKALQRNLPSFSKGCDLMLQAMYKTTFAGLEQFIQAIAKLPLEQNKNYVRCNFGEEHGECAIWSRKHWLLLL